MDQYDLKITYKDNSGFSNNVTHPTISIGQTKSVFFVNKYGVGVNGYKANSNYSLSVNGSAYLDGLKIRDRERLDCNTYNPLEFWTNRTVGASPNRPTDYCTVLNIGADYNSNFQLACSYSTTPGFWVRGRHDNSGNYHPWAQVYTTQNKPTATDVGALTKINNSDFYGLSNGNGTENGWLRVPTSGLIPNVPNGSNNNGGSNLGTSTWRFSTIYATYLNLNSGIDASGVVKTADSFNINDKAKWGVGGNDTYIYNAVSGKYLQFKNNGMLYISDVLIGDPRFKIGGVSNAWWNSVITIASDGVSEVGRYLDFHQGSNNTSDYNCRLETNSGNLICSGSIQQNSDAYLKENIVYIDEIIEDLVEEEPSQPVTYSSRETAINYEEIHPFKDFIRNSLKTATFKYKRSSNNTFGFIAQDINEHKIGQLFIKEYEKEIIDKSLPLDENRVIGTKKTLAFDLNAFSTVIAKALQEEIISRDIEIEKLEARIAKLENKDMETINNE